MTERPPKIAIPLKRIERLIELAKKHGLLALEVGHIKIVPAPAVADLPRAIAQESSLERFLKSAKNKEGQPLSIRQREDALLFGPNGIVGEIESEQKELDD